MFRLIEPSSGQTQNIVLVHSVSAHIMGSWTVYKIILALKIMFYSISRCIQSKCVKLLCLKYRMNTKTLLDFK